MRAANFDSIRIAFHTASQFSNGWAGGEQRPPCLAFDLECLLATRRAPGSNSFWMAAVLGSIRKCTNDIVALSQGDLK